MALISKHTFKDKILFKVEQATHLFLCFTVFYLLALCYESVWNGREYNCEKYGNIRYRFDYIYPARAVSCLLYKKMNPELDLGDK